MSDNKLLTEGAIRRFMKLANVETLTDSFISEMASYKTNAADGSKSRREETEAERKAREKTTAEAQEEEETLEEQEEPMDDEPMDDEPMDDEPIDDEPMDAEPEMGAADISLTEEEAQLLIDLGERLKEAMGDDMDMDDDMDVDMEDDDMDVDDDMDLDAGDDDDAGYGGERPMMEEEDRDEIVQEVLRRVTKRIVSAARK